ncbi:hydantoinase/oxoprolinase family protein [Kordiimonas aquimaris]|uniref:hydantoinase/oxoprolinase family protein n=1 Tax=Kordiimonas aquimaris TaxID=707591 RepID=UPI0021CFB8B8|nr:hydantoinase/oxoprolinase family protein [Kordiimonas aquimaris]
MYRVAADIGGTFTDFVIEDQKSGEITIGKVPTTPENPARGILNGVSQLIGDPKDIEFFVHGTTVGLNAFLERKGARVLLIMTSGISDTYTIARGHREELYKLHYRKPKQLVPRKDVHEVSERLGWDGSVVTPLDESSLQPIIDKVKAENIPAVAICLLHAYANPAHEQKVAEILAKELPGVSISMSHSVAPEWREVERASSTVMDAYVAPVVELYLETLKREFLEIGMQQTIHVMRSNGGVMTDTHASKHPITTLLSGPVGGSIGGVELSKSTGVENLLCVDMGGTSFDLSLVVDGQPELSNETVLQGLPLLMSIINIDTVGAGGGSLAWVENGGLRVGPQSAGSVPGPVCYGRGGTQPTITDANLFLGRLGKGSLLNGDMTLDMTSTASAFETLGREIGLSATELAEGMIAIGNAKMADAMRTITVGRGIDPREFTLVAFGGAGPMHAVELARELDIKQIIIPRFPGTFSAWGMLQSDIRHDFSVTYYAVSDEADTDRLAGMFKDMLDDGKKVLIEEGVPEPHMEFTRSIDLRYVGQEYTINVPLADAANLDAAIEKFHDLYQARYGHALHEAAVEIINLRLAAIGRLERAAVSGSTEQASQEPLVAHRNIIFNGRSHRSPIYKRDFLPKDGVFQSPAVVEEASATTIIPPGYTFKIDDIGNLLIQSEEDV